MVGDLVGGITPSLTVKKSDVWKMATLMVLQVVFMFIDYSPAVF